jgi:hypothetical protein
LKQLILASSDNLYTLKTIELAEQLYSFLSSDHYYTKTIEESVRNQILIVLTTSQPRPRIPDTSRGTKKGTEPRVYYPLEWANLRRPLQQALLEFKKLISNPNPASPTIITASTRDTSLIIGLYTLSSNTIDMSEQNPFTAAQIATMEKFIQNAISTSVASAVTNTIAIANISRAPKEAPSQVALIQVALQ